MTAPPREALDPRAWALVQNIRAQIGTNDAAKYPWLDLNNVLHLKDAKLDMNKLVAALSSPRPSPSVDLGRLRELEAKATPAPWFASRYRGQTCSHVWAEPGPSAVLICGDGDAEDVNADLIVEMRNTLPDLLDSLEAKPIGIAELLAYEAGVEHGKAEALEMPAAEEVAAMAERLDQATTLNAIVSSEELCTLIDTAVAARDLLERLSGKTASIDREAVLRLGEALAQCDAAEAACPVRHGKGPSPAKCPKCGAGRSEPCGPWATEHGNVVRRARELYDRLRTEGEG